MDWISVKDRLPDYKGYYLVHVKRPVMIGYDVVAYYDGMTFQVPHSISGGFDDVLPNHWMLLPEPPKEET